MKVAVLLAATLVPLSACSDSNGAPNAAGSVPPSPPASASTDASTTTSTTLPAVVDFADPDGRYTAEFPGAPSAQSKSTTLVTGDAVETVLYLVETNDAAYATNCVDYSSVADAPTIDLEGARDAAVANGGGTITGSTPIDVQGRKGLEYTATLAQGTMTGRVIADGTALCQVVVALAGTTGDSAVARAFLDSFTFMKDAA